MSTRDVWKAMHLLYVSQRERTGTSYDMLERAGIDCYVDTVPGLLNSGVIEEVDGTFVLSSAAATIFHTCTVGHRKWSGTNMWVDYPFVFVIMPYNEDWSDRVYKLMIEPAVSGASLTCVRADESAQIGWIKENIWNSILKAGVVVADVSELNANVFYELGMIHALGKESILLKRRDTQVPADFAGELYREYDIHELDAGKSMLQLELEKWAHTNRANDVKTLMGK